MGAKSCWGIAALLLGLAACSKSTLPNIQKDGGVKLVYAVEATEEGETRDLDSLARAVTRELDPKGQRGVKVQSLGADSIEITIPGATRANIDRDKETLAADASLELLIIANRHDHTALIEQAFQTQSNDVVSGGKPIGRWAAICLNSDSSGPILVGDVLRGRRAAADAFEQIDIPQDLKELEAVDADFDLAQELVKLGYTEIQNLVVINANAVLNTCGEHLLRVQTDTDASGYPCIHFYLNQQGGAVMNVLTTNNLPDVTKGIYRRMGILIGGKLISAPRLLGVIGDSVQITGKFTEDEVASLKQILSLSRLPPLPLNHPPASETWIDPP